MFNFEEFCNAEWRKAIDQQWADAWASLEVSTERISRLDSAPVADGTHVQVQAQLATTPAEWEATHISHQGLPDSGVGGPLRELLSQAWSNEAVPKPTTRKELIKQLSCLLETLTQDDEATRENKETSERGRGTDQDKARGHLSTANLLEVAEEVSQEGDKCKLEPTPVPTTHLSTEPTPVPTNESHGRSDFFDKVHSAFFAEERGGEWMSHEQALEPKASLWVDASRRPIKPRSVGGA
jgi:hypothetical protein